MEVIMNNLLNILILEAYQHDWSDLEIILTVLFCFLPFLKKKILIEV